MSPVTRSDFDDLVKNTTRYLEDILNRLKVAEQKIDALTSKPTRKAKTDD